MITCSNRIFRDVLTRSLTWDILPLDSMQFKSIEAYPARLRLQKLKRTTDTSLWVTFSPSARIAAISNSHATLATSSLRRILESTLRTSSEPSFLTSQRGESWSFDQAVGYGLSRCYKLPEVKGRLRRMITSGATSKAVVINQPGLIVLRDSNVRRSWMATL